MNLPPEERVEDLYEHAPCGYLSAADDGTIVRVNQTFLALTGHTLSELLSNVRIQDLMTLPGRLLYESQVLPKLILQGFVNEIACELQHAGLGSVPVPVLMNCRAVPGAPGRSQRLRFTFFNATEQRRLERELQQARKHAEHFQLIVETSVDAIISVDPTGRVQSWNAAAQRLFGATAAAALGQRVSALLKSGGDAINFEAALPSLRRGVSVLRETRCSTLDGRLIEVSITLSPHLEPPHELVGVSITVRDRSEAEHAQAQRLRSERRLSLGVRVAGLALAEVDYGHDTVELTPEAAALFGFGDAAQTVSRAALHARLNPDDCDAVMRQIADATARDGSGIFAMEVRVVWPSGSVRWLRVRKQVEFDGVGESRRPVSAVLAALDITPEREAALSVRSSEERFRTIFDNAAVGMAHVGLNGRMLRVNPKLCEITGYSAEELTTLVFSDITNADDVPADLAHAKRLVDGDIDRYELEKRYLRKNGAEIWVKVAVSLMRLADGRAQHFTAVVEDISARKAVVAELDRQRRFVDRLTEVVPSILYVFDIDAQRNVWVNSQARTALGFTDKPDRPWSPELRIPTLHPEDQQALSSLTTSLTALADGQTHECEYRLMHCSGHWRWFRSRETVFSRSADGRVREIIGVATDIDASKRAETDLREAARMKDTFIATLAHELRNPLAPIRNAVRTLKDKGPQEPELMRCRDVIERQVGQMARLLEDLLDVSRIAHGRVVLRRQPVSIQTVFDRALETARPWIDSRCHRLTVSLPEQPLQIDGDLTRLAQIFSNLLINAAKYTELEGHIGFSAAQHGGELWVKISDSGIGIEAPLLARVFEMFNRGAALPAGSDDGLGIGLALVKGLVESHGGQVVASSPGLGLGSVFTVQLPLLQGGSVLPEEATDTEADVGATLPESRHPAASGPLRVLVADDSRDIVDSLELLLSHQGFDIVVAYDGEQALERAAQTLPHVALLDLGMPHLNGFDVACRIRQQPWGARMTLIAQTGWGQATDRQRTRDAGFDHHIVKPVDPDVLGQLLRDIAAQTPVKEGETQALVPAPMSASGSGSGSPAASPSASGGPPASG